MKSKKEFRAFIVQEVRRIGGALALANEEQAFAFANIIYLTGAVDSLQDESARQKRIFATPAKKVRDRS